METFATAPPCADAAVASTRSAIRRRSSASGSRCRRTSTTSTSADWRTRSTCAPSRRPAASSYTSSFLALPPAGHDAPIEANDYQRTKVRARASRARPPRADCPLVTLVPGVIYGPGPATEGNLVGRLFSDHLRRPAAGDHRRRSSVVIRVCGRRGCGPRRGAERGEPGDEYIARRRERCRRYACSRCFARLRGTPLPRQIPDGLASARRPREERLAAG